MMGKIFKLTHLLLILSLTSKLVFATPQEPLSPQCPNLPSLLKNFTESERVKKLREIYYAAQKNHPENQVKALISLLKNRDFLPENASMLVIGPGDDFFEWLAPTVIRPDLRVFVSEDLNHRMASPFTSAILGDRTHQSRVWRVAKWKTPEIFEASPHVKTLEDLESAIKNQIHMAGPLHQIPTHDRYDLVLSISPYEYKFSTQAYAKKNGMIWVATEKLGWQGPVPREVDEIIHLRGALGEFLPMDDYNSSLPHRFAGQGTGPGVWILPGD